jgi:TRAP-type uncharacterized transport system substrate-binding protein
MKLLKLTLIFIILLLLPLLYVALESSKHKKVISIAVGEKVEAYTKYAKAYAKEFQKEGIKLNLVETKGSLEAEAKLMKGDVDFAFIQGTTANENVLALANVMVEPIWIFYKGQKISDLRGLKGKRIAICKKASGIYPVTRELLALIGINDFNSDFLHISTEEAYEKLKNNEIDVMYYIAPAEAEFLRRLMLMPNTHLLNFSSPESYKQFFDSEQKHFEIVKLYKHGFDVAKQIPHKDYKLLATNTLLATYNASDEMVRLMLKVANSVHKKVGVFNEEGYFPNSNFLKIAQHPAAKHYFIEKTNYYENNFPFWIAQSLNKLEDYVLRFILPLILLFAFFIEVMVPAMNLYSRRKIKHWYRKVNAIDNKIITINLQNAKERREKLKKILAEMRSTDDIASTHMSDFYTLQNQIINILDALEKRINFLHQSNRKF